MMLLRKMTPPSFINGVVDIIQIKEDILLENAEYYICGPAPFIKKQYDDLLALGVSRNSIRYEEFGPQILI